MLAQKMNIKKQIPLLKNKDVLFGIALNPEVSVASVREIILLADLVLLLAVEAGFSGQQFKPVILEKIKDLRELFPDVKIEIDGGVNPKIAR